MPEERNPLPVLPGRLGEFVIALDSERKEIQESGMASGLILFDGESLGEKARIHHYRFKVEYSAGILDDSPCRLIINANSYNVFMISFDGTYIILASEVPINEGLGKAKLETGSVFLLEKMIERLGQKAALENHIGSLLFEYKEISVSDSHLSDRDTSPKSYNEEQNRAIGSSLLRELTFIWGPPGTGKTTVIGGILKNILKEQRTVLLLSHTNVAVDNALKTILSILKEKNELKPGIILRLGKINTLKDEYPETELNEHVKELGQVLFEEQTGLVADRKGSEDLLLRLNWRKNYRELHSSIQRMIEYHNDNCEVLQKEQDRLTLLKEQFSELSQTISLCSEYYDSVAEKERFETMERNAQAAVVQTIAELRDIQEKELTLQVKLRNCDQVDNLRIKISAHASKSDLSKKLSDLRIMQNKQKAQLEKTKKQIADYKNELDNYLTKGFLSRAINRKKIDDVQQSIEKEANAANTLNDEIRKLQNAIDQVSNELNTVQSIAEEMQLLNCIETKASLVSALDKAISDIARIKKTITERMSTHASIQSNLIERRNQTESLYVKYAFYEPNELKQRYEFNVTQIEKQEANVSTICTNLADCASELNDVFELLNFNGLIQGSSYHEKSKKIDILATEFESIDGAPLYEDLEISIKSVADGIAQIDRRLLEIDNEIEQLGKTAILRAPVIGATLTKSYLDDTLISREFDTVVIDEASMAPIPALWLASYLAKKHLVIVGDFKQLSPIVISKHPMAQKWLGRDIFNHSGMQQKWEEDQSSTPEHFCVLTKQYRMHMKIAEIANIYYRNELKSPLGDFSDADKANIQYEEFCKWYGGSKPKQAVTLINTEPLHAWATGVSIAGKSSRLNHMSAALCVKLAFTIVSELLNKPNEYMPEMFQENQVLIVAPYKPHVKRIQDIIKAEYTEYGIDPASTKLIRAGTIHNFQGSESSVVIFDLVVDEPHRRANLFMHNNDDISEDFDTSLERLYTVAVTRAKYKLIIVGNFKYLLRNGKGSKTHELLSRLLSEYTPCDANALYPKLVPYINISTIDLPTVGGSIICTGNNLFELIVKDIEKAERQIVVYSAYMTIGRVGDFLPYFKKAIVSRGINIIVITKDFSEHCKGKQSSYLTCKQLLQGIGVQVLHKYSMHEKLIFIDDEILWHGSANLLSYTGATTEVMERRLSKEISSSYMKQMQVDTIITAARTDLSNTFNDGILCPLCASHLQMREGGKGGHYWKCTNCEFTRSLDKPFPKDGIILCKTCGRELAFSMRIKPIWKCDQGHRQDITSIDLKMPQMSIKIPSDKLNEVKEYMKKKKE